MQFDQANAVGNFVEETAFTTREYEIDAMPSRGKGPRELQNNAFNSAAAAQGAGKQSDVLGRNYYGLTVIRWDLGYPFLFADRFRIMCI